MDSHAQVRALCDEIRSAFPPGFAPKSRQLVEDLTGCIETLTSAYMIPAAPFDWLPYRLTASERTIAEALRINFGRTISKDSILNTLYFRSPDNEPEIKIVDVFICKIRPKLEAFGCPYRIVTVWGDGYAMVNMEDSRQDPSRSRKEIRTPGRVNWEGIHLKATIVAVAQKLKDANGSPVKASTLEPNQTSSSVCQKIQSLRIALHGRYRIGIEHGKGYFMVRDGGN